MTCTIENYQRVSAITEVLLITLVRDRHGGLYMVRSVMVVASAELLAYLTLPHVLVHGPWYLVRIILCTAGHDGGG